MFVASLASLLQPEATHVIFFNANSTDEEFLLKVTASDSAFPVVIMSMP
jgi:hypothetical protein